MQYRHILLISTRYNANVNGEQVKGGVPCRSIDLPFSVVAFAIDSLLQHPPINSGIGSINSIDGTLRLTDLLYITHIITVG